MSKFVNCEGRDKRLRREAGDLKGEESPGQGEDEGLREDSSSERTGDKPEWSRLLDNWLLSHEFIYWMMINLLDNWLILIVAS